MSPFTVPVQRIMSAPVRTLTESATLSEADAQLAQLDISALPIVDGSGGAIGMLSRTDLLRVGRLRKTNGYSVRALNLPAQSVSRHMTPHVEIVALDAPLADVARRMLRQHIHRLYVSSNRHLVGVVSTTELMQAVIDARISTPLAEWMHPSIVSVRADEPIALAIDRMAAAYHGAVAVVDEGWPVGFITQADALAAKDAPPQERSDFWMDPRLVCAPLRMPIFRAAEQMIATRARRLIAVDGEQMRGILTGMDFARLVAGAGRA